MKLHSNTDTTLKKTMLFFIKTPFTWGSTVCSINRIDDILSLWRYVALGLVTNTTNIQLITESANPGVSPRYAILPNTIPTPKFYYASILLCSSRRNHSSSCHKPIHSVVDSSLNTNLQKAAIWIDYFMDMAIPCPRCSHYTVAGG